MFSNKTHKRGDEPAKLRLPREQLLVDRLRACLHHGNRAAFYQFLQALSGAAEGRLAGGGPSSTMANFPFS
jgi:hypothetical protein